MGDLAIWMVSLMTGSIFGVVAGICLAIAGISRAPLWGLLSALLFAAAAVPCLSLNAGIWRKRFARLEQTLPGTVRLKVVSVFQDAGSTLSAQLYVTDCGVYLAVRRGRRVALEKALPREKIVRCIADAFSVRIDSAGKTEFMLSTEDNGAVEKAVMSLMHGDAR